MILDSGGAAAWLNPGDTAQSSGPPAQAAAPDDVLKAYPVSTVVSNARNDVQECVLPIPEALELLLIR